MKAILRSLTLLVFFAASLSSTAQVPQLINYQGRVAVGTTNFNGTGQFKFALVNAAGTTTYWSNDGTSAGGSQPTNAVSLTVTSGLYSVLLGDVTLTNMTPVPVTVFNNSDVRLRVWFNDGVNGTQMLAPDQRIAAVGYAMMAGTVPDGAITSIKLGSGAVTSTKLGSGLTLSGTTTGTFSGSLAGNATSATTATTATNATNFSGALAGDVTGTQSATVVGLVGGSTAANVNAATVLTNGATSASTINAIVRRDAGGSFAANGISLSGNFNVPATTATTGIIYSGGVPFLHRYGSNNFFAGVDAGNLTMTGVENTAVGSGALNSNTTSNLLTAVGRGALFSNTTGTGNTAMGGLALASNTSGSSNTAAGQSALSGNTLGENNTAMGRFTLSGNSLGSHNTAVGYAAMITNTSGSSNTAVGTSALQAGTTNQRNSAVGYQALFSSANSIDNAAFGYRALRGNGVGSFNTACGSDALPINLNGDDNTAIGYQSMNANVSGDRNVAIGYQSLVANNSGNSNICIGYGSGYLVNGSYNIVIGNSGAGGETGAIRIGTVNTHTSAYIPGIWGTFTTNMPAVVYVQPDGRLGTGPSARRFKKDIEDMGSASDALLAMRPVKFHFKPQPGQEESTAKEVGQFGLIAEEVDALNPDLVLRNPEGEIYSVRYDAVNAMLLNEFLKDHRRADARDEEIKALKKKIAELEAKDQKREARLAKLEQLMTAADGADTAKQQPNEP